MAYSCSPYEEPLLQLQADTTCSLQTDADTLEITYRLTGLQAGTHGRRTADCHSADALSPHSADVPSPSLLKSRGARWVRPPTWKHALTPPFQTYQNAC